MIGLESSYGPDYDTTPTEEEAKSPIVGQHDIRLLRAVAKSAGVSLGDILEIELQLYNFQPGQVGGLDREFLFANRLDDKLCSYSALHGLLSSAHTSLKKTRPIVLLSMLWRCLMMKKLAARFAKVLEVPYSSQ